MLANCIIFAKYLFFAQNRQGKVHQNGKKVKYLANPKEFTSKGFENLTTYRTDCRVTIFRINSNPTSNPTICPVGGKLLKRFENVSKVSPPTRQIVGI